MVYDLIIVGGGPAGMSAGIYAARKKIKTLLITGSFGGQSIIAADIQNWIGFKSISGTDLAKKMDEHFRAQKGAEIKEQTWVSKIEKTGNGFVIKTDKGESFETKTILLALGSRYRKLKIPGEKEFKGKGIFYCSTCDAPLMKNKVAAVIGGGNTGFASIQDLLPYASKIYLLEFAETLKAEPAEQEKAQSKKVEIITMAEVQEIFGNPEGKPSASDGAGNFVKGLKYKDRQSNEVKELAVDGIFVSIGYEPNSEITKDLVKLDESGQIVIDCKTQKTSLQGIWAAGDVTDSLYHQINTAIGDAVTAVLNIYDYLKQLG